MLTSYIFLWIQSNSVFYWFSISKIKMEACEWNSGNCVHFVVIFPYFVLQLNGVQHESNAHFAALCELINCFTWEWSFSELVFFFSNSLAKLESDLLAKYGQKPHDCCFLIRFMMKITLATNLVGWWMNWHSGRANKKKGQGTNKAKEKSVMQFQNSPTRNTKCIIQNLQILERKYTHTRTHILHIAPFEMIVC